MALHLCRYCKIIRLGGTYESHNFSGWDSAISIEFGQVIDPKINQRIRQTVAGIESLHLEGIIEMVPTYCALLIQYDALRYTYAELCRILEPICTQPMSADESELVTVVEIPTVYGGEFGPDLGFVASHNHLTEADVVSVHSGTDISCI